MSGHLCNGLYAIVVASTARDLPLLERSLDWAAVAVAVSVRQFGHLDCPADTRDKPNCNGEEDPWQTRMPIIIGIFEGILHCVIIEGAILNFYERDRQARNLLRSAPIYGRTITEQSASFQVGRSMARHSLPGGSSTAIDCTDALRVNQV